jgi:hypothetical protein
VSHGAFAPHRPIWNKSRPEVVAVWIKVVIEHLPTRNCVSRRPAEVGRALPFEHLVRPRDPGRRGQRQEGGRCARRPVA